MHAEIQNCDHWCLAAEAGEQGMQVVVSDLEHWHDIIWFDSLCFSLEKEDFTISGAIGDDT